MAAKDGTYIIVSEKVREGRRGGAAKTNGSALCLEQLSSEQSEGVSEPIHAN